MTLTLFHQIAFLISIYKQFQENVVIRMSGQNVDEEAFEQWIKK